MSGNQSVAMLGRWQPVHLGHQAALHALCERYAHVTIGIGSANLSDYRSPFALEDVRAMLAMALRGYRNYTLLPIPDLPDDGDWRRTAVLAFGRPEVFFTANPYVKHLLKEEYRIEHPASVIPAERRTPVSGTQVRRALARGAGWEELLPPEVAEYVRAGQLDRVFRRDYGLQTLAMETIVVSGPPDGLG